MKILCVGDFHGKFPKKLQKLVKNVDLVVSVGDFFQWSFRDVFLSLGGELFDLLLAEIAEEEKEKIIFDEIKDGEKNVLSKLNKFPRRVFTTVGNYDKSGVNDQYDDDGYLLHKKNRLSKILKKYPHIERIDYKKKRFGGVDFIGGFGHSSPGKVKSEAYRKYRAKLDLLFSKTKGPVIFVSHNMPYNCKLDVIHGEDSPLELRGKHYGSKLIRRIIERWQPALMIGGHFHENQGKCWIGRTLVVNCGAAAEGKGAIIDFDENKGKVKNVEFLG